MVISLCHCSSVDNVSTSLWFCWRCPQHSVGVSRVLMQAILFGCSILASLNLPAALEDLSGATVPPSLLEKAEQIRQLGGIDGLRQKMNNLPDLLQRNKEILDEVCVILIYLKFYLVRNCFVEKCYDASIHCTGLSLGRV